MSDFQQLKCHLEALIFVSETPLPVHTLAQLVSKQQPVEHTTVKAALQSLVEDYQNRGVQLVQTALGYRFQSRAQDTNLLVGLWQTSPKKLSRALMETLALIAYRQPITRAEIEAVRGVAVSSQIMQALKEKGWIEANGYREVPGRPTLWGTTRAFLADFNLPHLKALPSLKALSENQQDTDRGL